MTHPQPRSPRLGHTLIELVTAMVASAILLAGLGTVMFIAREVAYAPSASGKRLDAAEAVNRLSEEVRFATFFVTHTPYLLEFIVADRNADGLAERIRYQWSGTPGDPLEKIVNGGSPVQVVDSVNSFQCDLSTDAEVTSVVTTSETAESLLLANTNSIGSVDRDVTPTLYSAQRVDTSVIAAAAPAGALSWNATKIEFVGKDGAGAVETLLVELRSAGDPNNTPTSQALGQVVIMENNLSSGVAWNAATFTSPLRGLSLSRAYDIVWRGAVGEGGKACRLRVDDTFSSGVNESDDAGATWRWMPTRQIYYRVYGTYTSPGTTYNVTRNYATRVSVVLQAGNATHSRINASVPLENTPELLSAYWRTDFDSNPTTIDVTRDGTLDWAMASGSFNTGTLSGGVWNASGALESRPLNNFTNVTTVDVRCRNTSVGGNGAVIQINADRQGGLHAPLFVRLQLQSDGSQTLTLYGKSSDAANVSLFQRKNLANDFVRFQLTILPQSNVVNLRINDEDQATFSYPTYAPSVNNGFLTLYTDTSSSQFDYAEVRVAE